MRLTGKLVERLGRGGLPARSVRLRLTALYGSLFLVCGVGLLVITYLLVSHSTRHRPPGGFVSGRPFAGVLGRGERTIDIGRIAAALRYQNRVDLHQLLVESAIALAGWPRSRSRWAGWSPAACWRRCGRSRPGLGGSPSRACTSGSRCPARAMSSGSWRTRSTNCSRGYRTRLTPQRRFVANASHELRTPLAMMRTRLDVAVAKPEGVPPQTQALDAGLRKDLDRAEALLESLLVLARAQHGALTDRTIVSLDQIVIDALATRRDQIAERQLRCERPLPGSALRAARRCWRGWSRT